MKINAVNSYHFDKINFESKRQKNVQAPAYTTSTLKAIPVALLMAMSPVNAQEPMTPRDAKQVEYAIPDEEEIITQFRFENATPDGNAGFISVRSADNNKKSVEIHLNNKISSYAVDVNGNVVDAYRLREIEIKPEKLSSIVESKSYMNGGTSVKTRYYVIGSGTEYTNPPKPIDRTLDVREVSQPIVMKVEHKKYEISGKLYKYLKDLLKDNVEINEERSSTFIMEGRRK